VIRQVLVVDDERSFSDLMGTFLTKEGYEATCLTDPSVALEHLASHPVDVVLCDIQMPRMSGLDFLQELKERDLSVNVIMMSAYGSLETVVKCMKLGAFDYIAKPFQSDELRMRLAKLDERNGLKQENKRLRSELVQENGFDNLIGTSDPMRKLYEAIGKIATYKSTVLITGESGTGKEMVARAIHRHSKRSKRPFVAINCGAIPEALLESELFGSVRGAFTDAIRDRKGMFEEAHTGTVFLDELGELPLLLQVKLLRAIQEEEIRRVGDSQPQRIDVRIVAATIRDLQAEVEAGNFREDLYYRINVLPLNLPPLRERPDDIPLLVKSFIQRASKRLHKEVTSIDPVALRRLVEYPWPGNVRELENVIERACVFTEDVTIGPEDLPDQLVGTGRSVQVSLASGEMSIKKATRQIEEELIRRALSTTTGNRTAAAKLLEISHRALLYKIKEYEIDIPPRNRRD